MTDRLTAAASDVLAERKRQIDAEGWTPEHDDDDHMAGDIAKAAAAYALSSAGALGYAEKVFPWDEFKPKDQRRDLVRAGALILAEIERIDRRDEAAPAPGNPSYDFLLEYWLKHHKPVSETAAPPPPAPDLDDLLDAFGLNVAGPNGAVAASRAAIHRYVEALRAERDAADKYADGLASALFNTRRSRDAAKADAKRLREALEKIVAIENEINCGDWDEIEEARSIASTALAQGGNDG